jgi:hypothetical protein
MTSESSLPDPIPELFSLSQDTLKDLAEEWKNLLFNGNVYFMKESGGFSGQLSSEHLERLEIKGIDKNKIISYIMYLATFCIFLSSRTPNEITAQSFRLPPDMNGKVRFLWNKLKKDGSMAYFLYQASTVGTRILVPTIVYGTKLIPVSRNPDFYPCIDMSFQTNHIGEKKEYNLELGRSDVKMLIEKLKEVETEIDRLSQDKVIEGESKNE